MRGVGTNSRPVSSYYSVEVRFRTLTEFQSRVFLEDCTLTIIMSYAKLTTTNGLFSRTTWVSQYWDFGMQWHQLYHMQTICTSLQTDNHTNTTSLNFYRPDALPDIQTTVT